MTSRFRSFSAYTREDSREERLNWETAWFRRATDRGAGSAASSSTGTTAAVEASSTPPVCRSFRGHADTEWQSGVRAGRVLQPGHAGGRGARAVRRGLPRSGRTVAGDGRRALVRLRHRDGHNLTEFPYTPMYNSLFSDYESDDSGVLFKGSVSYRLDDETNVYFTRSEGYRIGGGNNFRVCTDEELGAAHGRRPRRQRPAAVGLHLRRPGADPARYHNPLRSGAAALVGQRTGHLQRHPLPRRLDRHPGGRSHPVQRRADHAHGGGAVSVAKGRNAGRRPARWRHCCVPLRLFRFQCRSARLLLRGSYPRRLREARRLRRRRYGKGRSPAAWRCSHTAYVVPLPPKGSIGPVVLRHQLGCASLDLRPGSSARLLHLHLLSRSRRRRADSSIRGRRIVARLLEVIVQTPKRFHRAVPPGLMSK